jgi:hypothetical protein
MKPRVVAVLRVISALGAGTKRATAEQDSKS